MGPFLQDKTQALVSGVKSEPQGLILVESLTVLVGQHQREGQTKFTYTEFTWVAQHRNQSLLPWLLLRSTYDFLLQVLVSL